MGTLKDGILERYRKRQQENRSQLERDCIDSFRWLDLGYWRSISFISKSHPDIVYGYYKGNFYRVDMGNNLKLYPPELFNERTMIGTTNTIPFEKYSDEELLVVAKTLDHAVEHMFSLYKGMIEQSADLD